MAITHYYVNPAINANSGTGTIGDPFGDLQYALNNIVGADGDQINIKVGTAEVLVGSLSLAAWGTPDYSKTLTLRGYTAAANDGGIGEIDCGGFAMWASAYLGVQLVDLECHTFGNNDGITLGNYAQLVRCEVHKGVSTPSDKKLIHLAEGIVEGCYIHSPGTGNSIGVDFSSGELRGCFIDMGADSTGYAFSPGGVFNHTYAGNIIRLGNVAQRGINGAYRARAIGNIIYNTTAGTQYGITGCSIAPSVIMNNIIMGFSGAGGTAIYNTSQMSGIYGYNAFYNNTANYSAGICRVIDETAHDVALAADPFVDAANGNFALTDAAKLLLRSAGWPGSYLGASTDPHITIGAVQYGEAEAGGSGVIRRAMRMIGG